jgi:hypothetical protein
MGSRLFTQLSRVTLSNCAAARGLERGNGLHVTLVNADGHLNRTLGIVRIGNTRYEEVDGKWVPVLETKE